MMSSREEQGSETMNVLLVEPERHPRPVEMGTKLEDLQAAVGGFIEVVYPFEDDIGLVMNEEGKLEGLPLNRALRDDDGDIYDVIAGPFLVVGLTDESFGSLSPEQMAIYEEKFHSPEIFIRLGRGIMAIPVEEIASDSGRGDSIKPDLKLHKTERDESR